METAAAHVAVDDGSADHVTVVLHLVVVAALKGIFLSGVVPKSRQCQKEKGRDDIETQKGVK